MNSSLNSIVISHFKKFLLDNLIILLSFIFVDYFTLRQLHIILNFDFEIIYFAIESLNLRFSITFLELIYRTIIFVQFLIQFF